ncbi:hypothetical protein [Streptomyces lydicus]|uniref:hypothetical protein n=1 Tax=Streptomyces lydicus TaxID=47763 RepID=UPI0036EF4315
MAYALGLKSSQSYELIELARRRPSDEVLLRFGALCAIHAPTELDYLWKWALGRPFPRRSDLVGLALPDELQDLVLHDLA